MMYLVDFFGTLFDVAAFEEYTRDRASGPFRPGELSRFLYEDGTSFLRDKGNGVIIITSAGKDTGKDLVDSALHGIPRMSVIYTEGKLKGEYLAPHISMYGHSPIFVDDSADHLVSMEAQCPSARLFQMRRDGSKGDGRWPVIRSVSELP